VRIDGTKEDSKPALLHVSEISDGRVMDVAKTLPVGSRVDATVLSVDASKGFRVSLSTKVQRKLKRKDPFVSIKPVAKALKNLPGAPPPTAALRLEKLADELSLDDLDALIESSQKKKKKKKAYVPRQKEAVQEEALSPTSLMSAFQSKEGAAAQKRQEFEMLMQDVVYESGSSLTDLRLLQGLQNKKKKGQNVYATGFWTKLFKPPPKGPKPAPPPSARPQAPPSDDAGA
jgi:predicted RNA-binding protein with RPS1 domain